MVAIRTLVGGSVGDTSTVMGAITVCQPISVFCEPSASIERPWCSIIKESFVPSGGVPSHHRNQT